MELFDEILGDCEGAGVSSPDSPLIVDVEEERVKLCVKGARCVSLSSELAGNSEVSFLGHKRGGCRGRLGDQLNILLVIFQDIVTGGDLVT